jgi:hypothetical protein
VKEDRFKPRLVFPSCKLAFEWFFTIFSVFFILFSPLLEFIEDLEGSVLVAGEIFELGKIEFILNVESQYCLVYTHSST